MVYGSTDNRCNVLGSPVIVGRSWFLPVLRKGKVSAETCSSHGTLMMNKGQNGTEMVHGHVLLSTAVLSCRIIEKQSVAFTFYFGVKVLQPLDSFPATCYKQGT